MSFLSPPVNLPLGLTQPELDKNSTYEEAKPLADIRGNGNLGLNWICENTQPKLTNTGGTHRHYHANIAGLLAHGVVAWIGVISIGGKALVNLNYNWNGVENYRDFSIDTDGGHTNVQTRLRVYFGTETQTADPILNQFHPGQTHPGYRGQAYIIFRDLYGGDGSFRVPNVSVQFRTRAEFDYNSTTYGDIVFGQGCNVVNILHHQITHPRAGLGLDENVMFNMADMAAKHLAFNDQGNAAYGEAQRGYVSPQFTKQRKARDWIKALLSYFDGFVTLTNGRLNLDWFPHEVVSESTPSEYTTIYQADLVDKPDINLPVWEDTITAVAIDYINIQKSSRKASLVVNSVHGNTVLGESRTDRLTRDWFWWTNQVQSFGEKYVATKGVPAFSGSLPIKRDRAVNPDNSNVAASLRGAAFMPGHIFRLNYSPYGLNVLCRITEINPRPNVYEVRFFQERGAYPQEYVPTPDEVPDLTLPAATALANWALINLPPALTGMHKNYIGMLAERFTKSIISWDITFNDSNSWSSEEAYLSEQASFAAKFALQEDVAEEAGPTTFEILGSTSNVDMTDMMKSKDEKQAENNELLLFMGDEVMSLETIALLAAAKYDVTAYRGRYSPGGSGWIAHSNGDTCWVIKRADLVQWFHEKFDLVYDSNGDYDSSLATKYFKTLTRNVYQEGSWSSSQSHLFPNRKPSIPTGLTVTARPEGLEIDWTRIEDLDRSRTWIQFDTASDFSDDPKIHSVGWDSNPYTIPHLTAGTTYYVRIKSVDTSGNESDWTNSVTGVPTAVAIDQLVLEIAPTREWAWAQASDDSWSPSSDTQQFDVDVLQGTVTLARRAILATLNTSTGGISVTVVGQTHADGNLNEGRITLRTYQLPGETWKSVVIDYTHPGENLQPLGSLYLQSFLYQPDGLSVHVATIYRRASSAPSTPTGGSYNFSTQTLTPPTDWSATPPAGTDPLYVSYATFSVEGTTGTDSSTTWTTPVKLVQDGADGADGDDGDDGLKTATGLVYFTTAQASAPSTPSATSYNFSSGAFTGLTTNWQTTPVEVVISDTTKKYWVSRFVVSDDGTQTITFSTPTGSINFGSDIQSDNYVSGSAGWKLERDTGDLEVNDGTFRGVIEIADSAEVTLIEPGKNRVGTVDEDSTGYPLASTTSAITNSAGTSPTALLNIAAKSPDESDLQAISFLVTSSNSSGSSRTATLRFLDNTAFKIVLESGEGSNNGIQTDNLPIRVKSSLLGSGYSGTVLGELDGNGDLKINNSSGTNKVKISDSRIETDNLPIQVRSSIGGTVLGELDGNGNLQFATKLTAQSDEYTWPTAKPSTSGYVLTCSTTGVLTWTAKAGVDTSGTPADNDYAKFTDSNTIEGRSYAEMKSDLGVVDTSGTPADNDYAKFTDSNTIEGRSYAEMKSDLGYMTDLSDDTSPELGGDLDADGNDITDVGELKINDSSGNTKVEISEDGIQTDEEPIQVRSSIGGTVLAELDEGGNLWLYDSNGATKIFMGLGVIQTDNVPFEVRSSINGTILGQIDGTGRLIINDTSGNTKIRGDNAKLQTDNLPIQVRDSIDGTELGELDGNGDLKINNSSGSNKVKISDSRIETDNLPIQVRSSIGGTVLAELDGNGSLILREQSTAPSGATNTATLYAEDDGSGKTRLMAQFGSGAAQQLAIEP